MTVIIAANVARVVLDVMVICVVVLSVWTLSRYAEPRPGPASAKHLARHVVKVASSHVIVMVTLAAFVTSRWGHHPTFVLPFTLLSASLTLSALTDLMAAQRMAKTERNA